MATNSLVTADVEPTPAESAASVVAIDAPPLFGWVQQVPIIGPLFVTPVVGFTKQIPFIGDILHPFIDYPLGYTRMSGQYRRAVGGRPCERGLAVA